MSTTDALESRPKLSLQRVFDAPRALVWRAWIRPDMLARWMGPVQWPAVQVKADVRVGGQWRICLRSPQTGEELWQGGVYREVVEPSRLVFTFKWDQSHEDGPPVDTLVTVVLGDTADGRTLMEFTHEGLKSEQSLTGHRHGWTSTFGRLDAYLSSNDNHQETS